MKQGSWVDERVEVLLACSTQSPHMLVHHGEHSISKMQKLIVDACIDQWDAKLEHSFLGP